MIGVVLIIALVNGVSVLVSETYLDNYIMYNVSELLKGLPSLLYTPCNFIIHVILSVFVPSSFDITSLSTPIMSDLTNQLELSVEVSIMTLVAANGLVNLISPTCVAIMGGLAISRVDYPTWLKWAWKVVLYIGLASVTILALAMLIF